MSPDQQVIEKVNPFTYLYYIQSHCAIYTELTYNDPLTKTQTNTPLFNFIHNLSLSPKVSGRNPHLTKLCTIACLQLLYRYYIFSSFRQKQLTRVKIYNPKYTADIAELGSKTAYVKIETTQFCSWHLQL